MVELLLAFTTGLFASLHCVGMCGPIIMGCTTSGRPVQIDPQGTAITIESRVSLLIPQALYHSGRIISYSTIGMIAGILGGAALISPTIQQVFTISFGTLMILAALFQLNIFSRDKKEPSKNKIFTMLASLIRSSSNESRFLVGLLTPLLPCGLLYGMSLHSASLSSPILGALSMGSFALGAIPALSLLAVVTTKLSARMRKNGTILAATLIIIMGILTILRGAGIYSFPLGHTDSVCSSPSVKITSTK